MKVRIYSDGGCYKNGCEENSVGGYGAIVVIEGEEYILSGSESPSTNNRMEMVSALRGLEEAAKLLKNHKPAKRGFLGTTTIVLTSDSKYLINGITKWLNGWKKRGWRTSSGGPVKNEDLWKQLYELDQKLAIDWVWVKGHDGHGYNERCDEIATLEIKQRRDAMVM